MTIQAIILAAGQGKRMHSHLPKVLHPLAGKPMLEHVMNVAQTVAPERAPIIIYGHQGQMLRELFTQGNPTWVEQTKQLGTGHAVMQALPVIHFDDRVLILYGDVPLISADTLNRLIAQTPLHAVGVLVAKVDNPTGYGRIIRDAVRRVVGIKEEKDADEKERQINEVNTGIYLVPAAQLANWLPKLKNANAQNEYYLTDIISFAVAEHIPVHTVEPSNPQEILGVNDRLQLAALERHYQRECAEKLLKQGVLIIDPARFDLRGELIAGKDVTIDINVIIEGRVVIGDGARIGAGVILRNTTISDHADIKPYSVIDGAEIAAHCLIGPFARIRPGTVLSEHVHIGNFVEVKNSEVRTRSKVNHLSYIGDSELGERVNIGAGTITCNYDGVNKHKTLIGDDVYVGSDTKFIAPVSVGNGATIAAGSTITKDVPPNQLTLTQVLNQRSKDWKKPQKK